MARPKEFEPESALRRAMELFWRNGYEATSMAELTDELGIGRASLYATFGSKHELYLKALECYLRLRDPDPLELLSRPVPALPAIRDLVQLYVEESIADEQRRGCMVVNTAIEMLPGDGPLARAIESNWDMLEGVLMSALMRARAQGELPAGKDPRAIARFLLVFLQGVRVLAKGAPNPERLRDAASQALAGLEP